MARTLWSDDCQSEPSWLGLCGLKTASLRNVSLSVYIAISEQALSYVYNYV